MLEIYKDISGNMIVHQLLRMLVSTDLYHRPLWQVYSVITFEIPGIESNLVL